MINSERVEMTDKPRATVRFEQKDFELLQAWAHSEYRTVPQLITAIVLRALDEKSTKENK